MGRIAALSPAVGGGQVRASAIIMRLTRSSMLEVLRQSYIGQRAPKGASDNAVNYHHALKNAVLPVTTIIGIEAAFSHRRAHHHRNRVQHTRCRSFSRRGDFDARLSDHAEPRDVHRRYQSWSSTSLSICCMRSLDPRINRRARKSGEISWRHSIMMRNLKAEPMSPGVGRCVPVFLPQVPLGRGQRCDLCRFVFAAVFAWQREVIMPHDPLATNADASLTAPNQA